MELDILTYNVMAPVDEPFRAYGQHARMQRIPDALGLWEDRPPHLWDLIVVQESMVPELHSVLRAGFRRWGYVYESEPIRGSWHQMKLAEGGVIVFSRWPIVEQHTHVYQGLCTDTDCWAAKGLVHVCIDVQGQRVHVWGTHLQAWKCDKSQKVRIHQMDQLGHCMERYQSRDDPWVMVGDLNVDWYSERPQWDGLLDCLPMCARALPHHPQSHPYTADPLTNQLSGVDDDVAYSSDAYPGGCYDQFLATGHCVCCPQEWLDYVVTDPTACDWQRSWMRSVPLKALQPFLTHISTKVQRECTDLSDHYPVWGHLVFPHLEPIQRSDIIPPEIPVTMDSTTSHQTRGAVQRPQYFWILPTLFLAVLVVTLALVIWVIAHKVVRG